MTFSAHISKSDNIHAFRQPVSIDKIYSVDRCNQHYVRGCINMDAGVQVNGLLFNVHVRCECSKSGHYHTSQASKLNTENAGTKLIKIGLLIEKTSSCNTIAQIDPVFYGDCHEVRWN